MDITVLKQNLIKTAWHHKASCNSADCEISLIMLRQVGELSGMNFTKEELEAFW